MAYQCPQASIVISSLGIVGRLSVLLIAGMLSSRGRRPFYHSGDRLLLIFKVALRK